MRDLIARLARRVRRAGRGRAGRGRRAGRDTARRRRAAGDGRPGHRRRPALPGTRRTAERRRRGRDRGGQELRPRYLRPGRRRHLRRRQRLRTDRGNGRGLPGLRLRDAGGLPRQHRRHDRLPGAPRRCQLRGRALRPRGPPAAPRCYPRSSPARCSGTAATRAPRCAPAPRPSGARPRPRPPPPCTISACEWDQATSKGTLFRAAPRRARCRSSLDQVLQLTAAGRDRLRRPSRPGRTAPAPSAGPPIPEATAPAIEASAGPATRPAPGSRTRRWPAGSSTSRDHDTPVFVPVYVSVTGSSAPTP